jgi:quercetin 2,3-dioxygenase
VKEDTMSIMRKISSIWQSRPTMEGAGVHLNRAFGNQHVPLLDPFLMLDDFHSHHRKDYIEGFPWHPHRGIETISYILQGDVEHGDSMGNKGVIRGGDVQWMTAGSGIVHQEMPHGDEEGTLWGFQLWSNLPASHKMMAPRYQEIIKSQIPEITVSSGTQVRVVCGEIEGMKGPVTEIVTDPCFLDVTMPPQVHFTHKVKEGHTVFAYVLAGKGFFDDQREPYSYEMEGSCHCDNEWNCQCGPGNLVLYEREGSELHIISQDEGVRFLLLCGKPIGEPVAWYGPIVMNTQAELQTAFDEYRKGTFLKHSSHTAVK